MVYHLCDQWADRTAGHAAKHDNQVVQSLKMRRSERRSAPGGECRESCCFILKYRMSCSEQREARSQHGSNSSQHRHRISLADNHLKVSRFSLVCVFCGLPQGPVVSFQILIVCRRCCLEWGSGSLSLPCDSCWCLKPVCNCLAPASPISAIFLNCI